MAWYDQPLTSLGNAIGGSETLAGIGQWMTIGSTVSGVIDSFFSARIANIQTKAQISAYKHQAALAEINAKTAYNNSLAIRKQGEYEAGLYGLQAAQQIADTKANQGKSGVKIGYGSSGNVLDSMKFSAESDLWSMSMSTLSKAQAAERQAMNYQQQGTQSLLAASNASLSKTNPFLALGNSAFAGIGNMLSKYSDVIGQGQGLPKQPTNAKGRS